MKPLWPLALALLIPQAPAQADDSTAVIDQAGSAGGAYQYQTGEGFDAYIRQTGFGNYAQQNQNDLGNASLTRSTASAFQGGTSNSSVQLQTALMSSLLAVQEGN